MHFMPLSDATHVSASFYPNSAEAPFPDVNVICRLEAATEIPSWRSTTPANCSARSATPSTRTCSA